MTKEQFKEIKEHLEYKDGEWILPSDIESIILNDGRGIYPDWKHTRFLFSENEVYVKHGFIKPYGARIISPYNISGDGKTLYVSPSANGILLDDGFGGRYRQPKLGDRLVLNNKIRTEAIIFEIRGTMNQIILSLTHPIKEGRLSFYDAVEYEKGEHLLHSSISEGHYFSFISNESKRKHKEHGDYHEIIKVKNIKEIIIKVGNDTNHKNYKLGGGSVD